MSELKTLRHRLFDLEYDVLEIQYRLETIQGLVKIYSDGIAEHYDRYRAATESNARREAGGLLGYNTLHFFPAVEAIGELLPLLSSKVSALDPAGLIDLLPDIGEKLGTPPQVEKEGCSELFGIPGESPGEQR